MDIIEQPADITVVCLTAESFPEGVLAAHQKLHATVPANGQRRYFGISRPEEGTIIYHAAAELLPGDDASAFLLPSIILRKGRYHRSTIHNYMQRIGEIGAAFGAMLQQDNIDPHGYCVEWYVDDKVLQCMVRIREGQ